MCFKSNHKEDSGKRIYIEKCNRYCFNQECLENHSEVCERFHKCLKCNKILKTGDKMVDEGKKMIDEGKKMIEEGNRLTEEVNNMLPLWGDTCTRPKTIQKCNKIVERGNKMIKKGNKMIEEGSKEHKCGWEKCRNCYKEVEIRKHKCYMQWKRQKGGICQTKIKDGGKEYKVKGCKNCDRKGCTVTFPDKTNKRVKYHIYQCKECKNCVKIPRKTGRASPEFTKGSRGDLKIPESKTKNENGYQCLNCGCSFNTTKCSYTQKYLFFDYEAMQETGKHVPNLVIAHDFYGNVD
ncbi:hypothetical protein Zmor_003655 [Zophobas morio]|uniref:Uncharacterized protein n=1 Tax=Zophobas morio TaxID=2755281 RepID=A0AA38HMN0_9CUCU|nr:hypothetical protein Zmor_003655 [Zophobas morio]